jgi:hypothetical protein
MHDDGGAAMPPLPPELTLTCLAMVPVDGSLSKTLSVVSFVSVLSVMSDFYYMYACLLSSP